MGKNGKLNIKVMNWQQQQSKRVNWEFLGAELVYIQDRLGRYISFYWQKGEDHNLAREIVEGKNCQDVFTPVALQDYLTRINRVIVDKIPQQCQWLFTNQEQSLFFELTMTPIITGTKVVEQILVMGHLLEQQEKTLTSYSVMPVSPEPYQEMLSQISSKIRKTLNLETIWQETVNSLGKKLDVSRCLLIYCDAQNQELEVKAEFCKPPFKSILGQKFALNVKSSYWQKGISAKEPVIIEEIDPYSLQKKSVLILSTFYQDQRNGIISLEQYDYCRQWSQIEIDLLNKLADQVGTAIAHATLYQELKKVSEYKSHFIANTSHELRTPIHVIINSVDLILEEVITEAQQQKEFLKKISQSSRHLLKLIEDLLDIHKIELGKMDIEFKTISLTEVLQNTETLMRPQAENKKLTFKIKYPESYEDVVLYSNSQRLFQVMLNLISNAIKFTHKGGIYILAEVISKKIEFQDYQFPGFVKISVADSGIGVPLNKQDELFQQFFQVDNSSTKFYPGTGLGLAISKTLVEAMGGTISFYSMGEDLGSTVTFTVLLNHLPLLKTY